MHEQEVTGILALAFLLGDTRSHRNSGNTGRADERVDLLAFRQENVHELGKQDAAGRAAHEGDDAHGEDAERHRAEEGLGLRRSADGDAEENDDDVHELVLRGLGQTVDHAALTEQVAEHQAADQRSCARNEQSDERGDGNRENDLFLLGNRTQGVHADHALLLRGQAAHDGRLDDRDERHVGISGNGDRAEQLGGQPGRDIDCGGAVQPSSA